MEAITLSAFAKINLTLGICGKREDGYHTLSSVMQSISLADTVTLEKIPQGIVISCDREHIPTDEKNICHKAAKIYFETSGLSGGVKITLVKRIPDGAGLGGGSADAASVLKGLAALYPANVDLFSIAPKIGADVPFCLSGKTFLCTGIGEQLFPVRFPGKEKLFCVVAKNSEALSTPKIYSLWDQMQNEASSIPSKERLLSVFQTGDIKKIVSVMYNHLELPAVSMCPEILQLKEALLKQGAVGAQMTGSGSAVFGIFTAKEPARSCVENLKKNHIEAHFCTLL